MIEKVSSPTLEKYVPNIFYSPICSNKLKANITKKEEQSQQMAVKIQEMQSAMQKAAVEAAKAVAAGQT